MIIIYIKYIPHMQIDIGEEIPHDLKKMLGRKYIFLLHSNEFNLKDSFENYTVTKIFDALTNDQKVWKKKKIHNPICDINTFATLFPIK